MKKILALLISIVCFSAMALIKPVEPTAVYADMGPKPDTQITIRNLEKSDYIVAFGMKYEFYGPHSKFTPEMEHCSYGKYEDLLLVYNSVSLPQSWNLCDISCAYCNVTEMVVKSGYMWPSEFILIILNKNNIKYYLSEETKTYAFHSYFDVDMKGYRDGTVPISKPIVLTTNYQVGKEIGEFFLRLIATLGIEILLALAFKFTKKSYVVIVITNTITQIGLNVGLNLMGRFWGKNPTFIIFYILAELLIVGIEAVIFTKFCKQKEKTSKASITLYALLANLLSFGIGALLWFII